MQHQRRRDAESNLGSSLVAYQAEPASYGNAALVEDAGLSSVAEAGPSAQHASPDHVEIGGDVPMRIGEHELTSGQINALADYVASPQALEEISAADMVVALELISKEHLTVDEEVRLQQIFPDYDDLSLANGNHFGASDPGLCEPSGSDAPTNRSEIAAWVDQAIRLGAEAGNAQDPAKLDVAMAHAAFGGHFVADAFSSGHLFCKADMQAQITQGLSEAGLLAQGALVAGASARIMEEGAAKLAYWRYEVAGVAVPVMQSHIATLLTAVLATQPALFGNGVVLAVHDRLSEEGVIVSDGGAQWSMLGDDHLDPISAERAAALIAQVYDLVRAAYADPAAVGSAEPILAQLPEPIDSERDRIRRMINVATTVSGGGMEDAVVAGSVSQLDAILEKANESIPLGRLVRIGGPEEVPEHDPGHDAPDTDDPSYEPPWAREPEEDVRYVVRSGDWLSSIAERYYGDPMRYPEIFEANAHRIEGFEDPDCIEPGWELVIPNAVAAG